MRATLPSTAKMLTDLRSILVEQITQHRIATQGEAPTVQSATVTAKLMQAAAALEASTHEEQRKAAEALEDLTEEEREQVLADANRFLEAPQRP